MVSFSVSQVLHLQWGQRESGQKLLRKSSLMLSLFLSAICWDSHNTKVHGLPCTGMWFRVAALSSFWNVLPPSSITNVMSQFHQGAPTHPPTPTPGPGVALCLHRAVEISIGPSTPTPCAETDHQSHLIGPICGKAPPSHSVHYLDATEMTPYNFRVQATLPVGLPRHRTGNRFRDLGQMPNNWIPQMLAPYKSQPLSMYLLHSHS